VPARDGRGAESDGDGDGDGTMVTSSSG